jgi:hypothetical protein
LGDEDTVDFSPVTYTYPVQYSAFLDDMQGKEGPWIAKLVAGWQGQGILLLTSEKETLQFYEKTIAKSATMDAEE